MQRASTPWWQQATALVSLSAGGAITGFSFMPKTAVDFSSPTSLPVNLLALQHSVRQAPASDATLRSAIVNVAQHYLQLAQGKTPAEMEAMIWQRDSIDHADHGPSCAAFASLTLELAAKVVGQESWVTGGSSYPWPLHSWADVRVDENPASPGVVSIQQDAQTHGRWHPLGDGYQPQPGDWVLFQGHVEVVTEYAHEVLHTIGGDSLPNFSVNAHQYPGPLANQGVVGFVDNGSLSPAGAASTAGSTHGQHGASHAAGTQGSSAAAAGQAAIPGTAAASSADPASAASPAGSAGSAGSASSASSARAASHQHRPAKSQHPPSAAKHHASQAAAGQAQADPAAGLAAIPGSRSADPAAKAAHRARRAASTTAETDAVTGQADIPGAAGLAPAGHRHRHGAGHAHAGNGGSGATDLAAGSAGAAIPGVGSSGQHDASASQPGPGGAAQQHQAASTPPADETSSRQAFIDAVAPGAMASQRAYGVPAAVTIAQAIEESNWGQSLLASKDNNLFGMKGTGPAGSEALPTQEYENGQWITTTAPFRVYHNFAESIDDHGRLLADSGYYGQAMAVRRAPNAFASALTGVYATDPSYGAKLIGLMRQYNLYQYDAGSPAATSAPAATHRPRPAPSHQTTSGTPTPAATPTVSPSGTPAAAPTHTGQPTPAASPAHTPTATPAPSGPAALGATPTHTPAAAATNSPAANSTQSPAATPRQAPAPAPTATAGRAGGGGQATGGSGQGTQPASQAGQGEQAASRTGRSRQSTSRAGQPASQAGQGEQAASRTGRHGQSTSRASRAGQAAIPGVPDAVTAAAATAATPSPAASAVTRADHRAGPPRTDAHPRAAQSAVLTAEQMPLRASPAHHTASPAAHEPDPDTQQSVSPAHQSPPAADEPGPAAHRPVPATPPTASRSVSGAHQAPSAAHQPVPATHQARPAAHQPSRATHRPVPATHQAQPAAYQPGPAAHRPVPAAHQAQPAAHQPSPAALQPQPAVRPTSQVSRSGSSRRAWTALRRYQPEIPPSVHTAFLTSAKVPLRREEPLYREVAIHADIPWKVLAAADWMQCGARSGYSPVYGEKLGAINPDGTSYTTRSAGLAQCADDLRDLAWSVYQIDLTERRPLSVGDLASVFAAFRWGRLLVVHRTSALEFPYSVAGLTTAHLHMRWPKIAEPDAPDKPGTRFRKPFGAVPVVLGLGYPAVI